MTPDQDLKAAMLGAVVTPKRGKTAKAMGPEPRRRPRRSAWPFRWGIKLLVLALMLMISRGLMQAPEVRAMWAEARDKLVVFVEEERAARALAAAEKMVEPLGATDVTSTDRRLPESTVAVRRLNASADLQVLAGPVEDVLSGNAVFLSGTPVVLDGLVCAAPGTERGDAEAAALAGLTKSQPLRCTVTGAAGDAAVAARCTLKGGRDLANAMLADRYCQSG